MKSLALVALFIIVVLGVALAPTGKSTIAEDSPLIHHASVQPTKVYPGDTMTVTAEVSDSSGVESVTADMGGIETISLSLIEGSIEHGTWQGQWLVHDTTARDYVTTIVATNSQGKGTTRDLLWRDPQTYERYHIESEAEQTTTEITLQTALTMTFIPNVTGDFLILAYAVLGQSDTSYFTEWQVDYGTGPTVIDTGVLAPGDAAERVTAGSHDVVNLSTGTPYSFRIKYRTSNALGTASIEDLSLFAISVTTVSAGPDDYTKHAETTAANTTSGTYVDNTTLTFIPSTQGDYVVLASMGIACDVTNKSVSSQLTLDTVSQGEVVREFPTANQYEIYAIVRKVNLTAASHTFKLQYMTTGGTAYVRNARITAVRLSDLGDAEYVESEGVDTTTSATYVVKPGATMDYENATYENNLALYFALMNGSSAVEDYYAAGYLDGVLECERVMRPSDASDYLSCYALDYNYMTSAPHTSDIRFHSNGSRVNSMKNVRILVLRLDTLTPFSDSGHTTYDNDFQAEENTVYIQGCYFSASTAHHVAYYDSTGYQWLSDGVSSDDDGVVNSMYVFTSNPTAASGTWHAVIYKDSVTSETATGGSTTTLIDTVNLTQSDDYWNGWTLTITAAGGAPPEGESQVVTDFVQSTNTLTTNEFTAAIEAGDTYTLTNSPPASYTASDPNSTRECAFGVAQSAIPEFPTIIAAISTCALCFGIYWWMRKRRVYGVQRVQSWTEELNKPNQPHKLNEPNKLGGKGEVGSVKA